MSTTTRRERDRASARRRLVRVALRILEREGPAALTIRRVATEVEYTAPVVYQHFAGKEALLLALVEVGYQRLHARMSSAADAAETGDARVLATARAYVEFAGDSPHLYQLMHTTAVDAGERFRAATPVTELTVRLLTEWAAELDVAVADPMETCEVVWGTLHGIANLGLLDTIGPARATHLADRAVRALLLAWRTAGSA
jgi:AcrR family transcriptional regulator